MSVVVEQGRDAWDWAVIAVTLLGAVTATVAFAAWALDRRRRPEFSIQWWYATGGDALIPWLPSTAVELPQGGSIRVRVAIQNVGDALADQVLTNFVAPECLKLTRPYAPDARPITSGNPYAGIPPDLRVTYFAGMGSINGWDWLLREFQLDNESSVPAETVRVLFDSSCPSLKRTRLSLATQLHGGPKSST